jgi:3-methyladenine DNA glycosylase AlkD
MFNDLKRSLKSDESISSYWAAKLSQSIYLQRCRFLEAVEVDLTIYSSMIAIAAGNEVADFCYG